MDRPNSSTDPPRLPPGRQASRSAAKSPIWWRFSLRELLLAMTAAGALLALAVKSAPAPPTPFFQQFDALAEINAILKELKITIGSSGGGSSSSFGGGSTVRRWDFSSHQADRPLGEIAAAFADRVEAQLVHRRCTITGRGTVGDRKKKQLSGFSYSYEYGARRGDFIAEFVDLPNGDFRVYAFCVEFTRR